MSIQLQLVLLFCVSIKVLLLSALGTSRDAKMHLLEICFISVKKKGRWLKEATAHKVLF